MRHFNFFLLLLALVTPLAHSLETRPAFHFTPRHGWINDPTGLVEHNGTYDLFYQYYNGGWALADGQFKDPTVWGPMHWGHAISRDLVHWKEEPVALAPDKKIGASAVEGMIFSGSVVFDKDNTSGFGMPGHAPLVAMYTLADTFGPASGQRQAIAYSLDHGVSWKKYAGNPVIGANKADTFRDPQVLWFPPLASWAMVLSCGDRVCFYKSPDLKRWSKVGEFGAAESGSGIPWECPDLFPLKVTKGGKTEIKWVLIVSVQHGAPGGSFGTRYFVGDFDGTSFKNSAPASDIKWLDYGSDNYASRTWADTGGGLRRRTMIGWMSNWNYGKTLPATSYRGSMTVPREITLHVDASGYYLAQQPRREVLAFLGGPRVDVRLSDRNPVAVVQPPVPSLVNADIVVGASKGRYEIAVFEPRGQHFQIFYDAGTSQIFVDRRGYTNYAFSTDKAPQVAYAPPIHGHVRIKILLDNKSVEAFVNGGRQTFTDLLYPEGKGRQ